MAIRLSANRLDLGNANLTNAELRGWSETVNALGNVTGATTINLSLGNVVTATTTGATTWTVTNASSAGTSSFTLILTNGGSAAQTWMSGTQWANGAAPTLNSSGTDVLTFFSTDAGTTWRGGKGGPAQSDQVGQKLFGWGSGKYGQLGLGETTGRSSPVQLAGQWASISPGQFHSLGFKADGSLFSWGLAGSGQLGLGDTIGRSSPVQIAGTWVNASAGRGYHNLMLKADSSLFVWGHNGLGQLGLGGDTIRRSSPVQLAGTWLRTGTTTFSSFGIRADGSMWAWGYNSRGVLGVGDTANRSSPVQVLGGSWKSVAGQAHSVAALKADGTLWTWGGNDFGVLGHGHSNERHSSPVQIAGTWAAITANDWHMLALRHNGTLWAWGYNKPTLFAYSGGQLGLGDTISRSSPVQVGTSTWSGLPNAAFRTVSAALRPDGSLWTCGSPYLNGSMSGMLGHGDVVRRSSPAQVAGTWSSIGGGVFHMMGFKI